MALRTGAGVGSIRIGNSGELQNITSLDSTTAATIGSAAGGATKLVTDYTSLSGGSTYSFSLTGGYHAYFLHLYDLRHVSTSQCDIMARLTNSSGSAITDNNYQSHYLKGTSSTTQSNMTSFKLAEGIYRADSYTGRYSAGIWIYHAQTSSFPTTLSFDGINHAFSTFNVGILGFGQRRASEVNNSFYIYPQTGSTAVNWGSGGSYALWGVDL